MVLSNPNLVYEVKNLKATEGTRVHNTFVEDGVNE